MDLISPAASDRLEQRVKSFSIPLLTELGATHAVEHVARNQNATAILRFMNYFEADYHD